MMPSLAQSATSPSSTISPESGLSTERSRHRVFPNRFAENHEQIIESHKRQIREFTRYLSPNKRCRPKSTKSATYNFMEDEMKIQSWTNGSRSRLAFARTEIIQVSYGIEWRQRRERLLMNPFLRQRVRNSDRISSRQVKFTEPTDLAEEDLRRFVPIDINFLNPTRREQGVFKSLRILQVYQDIIRGLVSSHFEKTIERNYIDIAAEGPSQDLTQGKSRGLVVLFHGVPGVGKTATASAVAMENQKPLFVIHCRDLGLSPSEVERTLISAFRLPHMWYCVLLLDKADDMKRNTLVAVFLRVLEYYNGILFLTTNCVGTIDEALRSCIHMSLYYPPLDKAQTRDIFRLNVAKLREVESQRYQLTGEPAMLSKQAEIVNFAKRHYEEHARLSGCWNSRQIRKSFQITSS
ncbi:hypothetical protein KVR01_002567 [Diaporthe batatas]|uniref:uncharacterized protein n=1 Tax=Diaporthe batatas TaxID=748121 RepID=UPI001D0375D3|nr:uncharacterized protein KVR01_002567 [Diaporthe batatas]KAG8166878.1 hypothetical protein KVR01_002567 [Diaporthe batatas]